MFPITCGDGAVPGSTLWPVWGELPADGLWGPGLSLSPERSAGWEREEGPGCGPPEPREHDGAKANGDFLILMNKKLSS
uniref:Uncharacterized protein n=1 Tax=Knipowitschia caucasica TaxID=637954 RepID=A0AAV2JY67_KNICA